MDEIVYSNIQSKITCNGEQISCNYVVVQGWGGSLHWQVSYCPNGCSCQAGNLPEEYTIVNPNNGHPYETWTGDLDPDGRAMVYGECGP